MQRHAQCAFARGSFAALGVKGSEDMKSAVRVVVAALSAGWVIPGFLASHSYLRHVADTNSGKTGAVVYSFPFLHFAEQMLALSAAWLFVVMLAWSYVVLGLVGRSLPTNCFSRSRGKRRAG